MDLTPLVRPGTQVIERYAPGGFRIAGQVYREPVLVFPERTLPWPGGAVSEAGLAAVIDDGGVDLLLLGLGRGIVPVPAELRAALKRRGVVVEAMGTGAACRTYNVLLAEDRRVVAALLPL